MNLDNISRLIERIESEPASLCVMGGYSVYLDSDSFECGTAHCVGGWVQVLVNLDNGRPALYFVNSDRRAAWLDIDGYDLAAIECMENTVMSMPKFDRLEPHIRKQSMLELLRIFRDTGNVDWDEALQRSGVHV